MIRVSHLLTAFLGVLIYLIPTTTLGAELANNIVKIRSKPCTEIGATLKGSGFGFQHAGQHFILTSEHVVLASRDEDFCHTATPSEEAPMEAALWSVNWWLGVAVLKVEDENASLDWPNFTDLVDRVRRAETMQPGSQVIMAGFPHDNNLLFADHGSSLLTMASGRNSIPGVERTYEVRGVVERGMSGGPMLTGDGLLRGVISHQFLQPTAGGPSYVERFGVDTLTISNHLIVIPFVTLIPWLTATIDTPEPRLAEYGIRKDPYAQLAGKDIILVGDAKISFVAPKGGRFPTFGAGDGVGTGGTAGDKGRLGSGGHVIVEYQPDYDSASDVTLPGQVKVWLQNLESLVARKRHGTIDCVIVDRKPVPIHSLAGFFNQLNEEQSFAAVNWSVKGLPKPKSETIASEALDVLSNFATFMDEDSTDQKRKPRDVVAIRSLYEQLFDLFRSTKDVGHLVYSVRELETIKANTDGWNGFIAHNFSAAVDLRSKLEAFIDIAQNEQF